MRCADILMCIVIGGGAALDMVGFAVATAHRGLRLIRFPTTSLSQGDGGVGVKNGVNYFGKKNWVGHFLSSGCRGQRFLLLRGFPAIKNGQVMLKQ